MIKKIYIMVCLVLLFGSNQAFALCGVVQPKNKPYDLKKDKEFCPIDWSFRLGDIPFTLNEPRDSLPKRANFNNTKIKRDPIAFPFLPYNSKYYVALDMVVHLPAVGNIDGYRIYQVTDGLGIILRGGDTNWANQENEHTKINLNTGERRRIFPEKNSFWGAFYPSGNSLGVSLNVAPVLLSPKSSVSLTERKKLLPFT